MTISRRQRTWSAVERKKPEWRGGPVSFWPERFGICWFSRHGAATVVCRKLFADCVGNVMRGHVVVDREWRRARGVSLKHFPSGRAPDGKCLGGLTESGGHT